MCLVCSIKEDDPCHLFVDLALCSRIISKSTAFVDITDTPLMKNFIAIAKYIQDHRDMET